MNKISVTCLTIGFFLACVGTINAEESKKVSFGYHFMAGLRYDNMRMCVATPADIKGGPIGDIMFDTRLTMDDNFSIVFNLPVMRPILFGAAFQMLQFEPQFSFEVKKEIKKGRNLILGPGLGASFHYGPDYKSDKENRGDAFFAAGPLISTLFGLEFGGGGEKSRMFGFRLFYVPLFSTESDLSPGTVFGGAIEGHFGL